MSNPSYTYALTNGTTADASQVMQNFNDILNGVTDGTKDMSISALTCAGTATFNGAMNFGNGSVDDLTFTGSLASSIPIKTTRSFDIGSADLGLRIIYLGGNSTNTIALSAPSSGLAADVTFTLPPTNGTAKQILQSDGAGVATWVSQFAGTIDTADADQVLTVSSSRKITYTSFSGSRSITLPTTSIVAGEVFMFANTQNFDMVIKSSAGTSFTTANSANFDATVQGGYVIVQALQAAPTTPAHWRVIEVYDRKPTTVGSTGDFTSGITIELIRHNKSVVVNLPATSHSSVSAPASGAAVLATRFFPASNTTNLYFLNGSVIALFSVNSDGSINTTYRDYAGTLSSQSSTLSVATIAFTTN